MKLILYRTQCFYCHRYFDKGKAILQRVKDKWYCHCFGCYKEKHKKK